MIQHAWVNQATQFNWALTQLDAETDWVLRLDADEVLTPELVAEIQARLPYIGPETDGLYCGRRMTFQGRLIRHGGVFPVQVLRLFRYGRGQCENRWMDEHIKVAGSSTAPRARPSMCCRVSGTAICSTPRCARCAGIWVRTRAGWSRRSNRCWRFRLALRRFAHLIRDVKFLATMKALANRDGLT